MYLICHIFRNSLIPSCLPKTQTSLTVNIEREKINLWFIVESLSFNLKKTKCTLFHKIPVQDSIPLKCPDLKIAKNSINRTSSLKFLEVIIHENITWKNHIETFEKTCTKSRATV